MGYLARCVQAWFSQTLAWKGSAWWQGKAAFRSGSWFPCVYFGVFRCGFLTQVWGWRPWAGGVGVS